jgi:DNA-binding MarR family transcriptional regulator
MAGPKRKLPEVDMGVLEQLLGYHVRRAQLSFFAEFAEACADLGLSPGLFAVLEVVYRNPGLTQTAVSKALGTDRSAMVAAIDKLESMNLLERRPSENDRRSYALYATEHCQGWYPSAEDKVKLHEEKVLTNLDSGEREQLLALLQKLNADKA